jgi:hypothetical protein
MRLNIQSAVDCQLPQSTDKLGYNVRGILWTLFIKTYMTQKKLFEIMPTGFAKNANTNVHCIVNI